MAGSTERSSKAQEMKAEEVRADAETMCGFFCWKPTCLQFLAKPVIFLVGMCLYVAVDGLNIGVVSGTITTVEARYQFTLTEMGSLQTSFSVAGVIGLLLVTYLGSLPGINKPRLMGICGLLTGVGVIIQCLPQFLYDPYQPPGGSSHGPGETNLTGPWMTCSATPGEMCLGDASSGGPPDIRVAYWVLFTGYVLQSAAVTGMWPVGIAYIADSASEGTTTFYIGILRSLLGLGPVIGVLLAAASIRVWVDFYRLESGTELALGPEDPGWVGAWWLALLINGSLLCIFSIQFLFFPKRLPEKSPVPGDQGETEKRENQYKSNPKEFVLEVWKALKNPYCFLTCIAQSSFSFIAYGYGIFLPKYLEVQFGYERHTADLLTGVLLAPAYAIGEFGAGSLVKKLDMKLRGIIRLAFAVLLASAVGLIIVALVGCDNDNVAGVFSSYDGRSSQTPVAALVDPCNQNCSCSLAVYAPVCSGNGLTYFSPCHAGCTQAYDNRTFAECACLERVQLSATQSSDGLDVESVVEGACDTNCWAGIPFLVVLTVVLILCTAGDLLRLTIIVRTASSEKNRVVALGLTTLTQTVGAIPAGIVFGSLIDSSCLVWQESCQSTGACLLYDLNTFRLVYNGMALGIAAFSVVIMFILMLWNERKLNSLEKEQQPEQKEQQEQLYVAMVVS